MGNHRLYPAGAIRFPETTLPRVWGRGSLDHSIFDNFLFVQVQFLPLRCREASVSPAVATDHHSAKRGDKAVPWNPTRTPAEQGCLWAGPRIHVGIVVTLHQPTRMMGVGHKAWRGAGRLSPRPRSPPAETRRSVGSYGQRQTERRNGVTPCRAQRGAGVHRIRHGGGRPQEAHASGTARGYADVGTVGRRCSGSVTPTTL